MRKGSLIVSSLLAIALLAACTNKEVSKETTALQATTSSESTTLSSEESSETKEAKKKETTSIEDGNLYTTANKGVVAYKLLVNSEVKTRALMLFVSPNKFELSENSLYFINSSNEKEFVTYTRTPVKETRTLTGVEYYRSPEKEYNLYLVNLESKDDTEGLYYRDLYWEDGTELTCASRVHELEAMGILNDSNIHITTADGGYATDFAIKISPKQLETEIGTGTRSFELVVTGEFPEGDYAFHNGSTRGNTINLEEQEGVSKVEFNREKITITFESEESAPKDIATFIEFLDSAHIKGVTWNLNNGYGDSVLLSELITEDETNGEQV